MKTAHGFVYPWLSVRFLQSHGTIYVQLVVFYVGGGVIFQNHKGRDKSWSEWLEDCQQDQAMDSEWDCTWVVVDELVQK